MASGEQFTLESGDALFIPNGDGHALLSDPQATVVNVAQLPSETVCSTVSCINAGDQPDCPERAVIFSGCMDFELGGMQPLVKAMPEVMRVSSLLNTWPEIQPLLVAMERESLTRQAGYAGILARLADVVAALIVRGWVACGCGNAAGSGTGPARSPAGESDLRHASAPGVQLESGRSGAGGGSFTFAVRGTFSRRHRRPPPPAISPSCVCGWRCSTSPMKARRWKKSPSASGISRWRPSAGLSNASPRPAAGGPARHGTLESAFM